MPEVIRWKVPTWDKGAIRAAGCDAMCIVAETTAFQSPTKTATGEAGTVTATT